MKALCNFMRQMTPPLGLSLLLLISSSVTQAEDNPYATHYQAQSSSQLHSLQAHPQPQLFSGKRPDTDNIQMLEDGYDLMGFSGFEAGDIPPAQALAHGRAIQADTILVYVKKTEEDGQSPPEKSSHTNGPTYRYYATFWARLPPPVLGVHVIKLVPRDTAQKDSPSTPSAGVRVIAVIHGSVAEKSGILRGDQLLAIKQEKVEDAATLSSLVSKFKGQTVTLQLERAGEPLSLQISL